ncbi:MAG: DUF3307 domain-containing protein [Elusimicrobiota bacterium]
MEIFWRLILAHLLADFTFQTDYVNRAKRSALAGMFLHVFTHIIFSYILVREYIWKTWFYIFSVPFSGLAALFLLSAVHFAVDEIRVYMIKKLKYPDNTFSFLADQFAHIYFIFMFSPFSFENTVLIPEKWVFMISCLVMVTHFATVFFYFLEKDFSNAAFPGFDQKYFMIFERTVIWAFFMMPGIWWIGLLLLWLIQLFYVKKKRIMDVSALNFYGSIFFASFFGILSRLAYYGF